MLNVIYGDASADRHGALFDKLKQNISAGIKSFVLVPEQLSVSTEREVVESLGVSAQIFVEVWTFSRLGNEVLSQLGPLRLNYIDSAGREILSRRALQIIQNELQILRPNVGQKGFSGVLTELVSEFKRYGLSPESLEEASAKVEKTELKSKLADLAKFYRTYSGLIDKKNSDAEDNLSIARGKLKDFDIPEGSELLITEFKSFTPLEGDVLTELMKKMKNTSLFLLCDSIESPSDIFASSAATYRSLRLAAEDNGIAVSRPKKLAESPKASVRPEFVHLWNNFFRVNPEKYEGKPEHIHIISPLNHYDEAERAARIIRNLIRTRGYRQNDFLILARESEKYDRIMPLIFEKYGLNVFVDNRRSILGNPFVQCISAMLEILAYGFSYERVITMAKSGFYEELSRGETDIFDNYLLAVSPSHAMWNDEQPWEFNPDKHTYDMELINHVKNVVIGPIYRLKSKIHGRKNTGEIVSAVMEYISECNYEKSMKDTCRDYSESGMTYLAEEYRRIWNSVISVLSRMNDIMGDEEITYLGFYEMFTSACAGIKVGISPQTLDEVTFSNIDIFRNTDAKVVIVLGVNYGVFPKGYSAEGLLSDSEREILREYGISLAMTANEKSDDEQNLIYNVLASASEELYLSAPVSDNVGNELEPSKIITKICTEIFDFTSCGEDENESLSILDFESPNAVFDELKRFCAKTAASDMSDLPADIKIIYDYFMSDEKAEKKLIAYLEKIRCAEQGYDELSKKAAADLYGREIMLSASKMEKFNACAFSYFMRYGLIIKPRDKAKFDPLSMGNILHAALERYFSDVQSRNTDYDTITRDECEREVTDIVNDIAKGAEEVMYQTSAYYKYLIMRISGIASTTAWETVKFYQNSEFRPYGFEIKIGDGGDVPPMTVKTDSGSARVEGFIDRADSAVIYGRRYISIIDYKSSARDLDVHLAADGVHFQPLVYTNALINGLDVRPAAMLYQQMNDPIIDESKAKSNTALEKEIHKNVKTSGWVVDDKCVFDSFDKTHAFVSGKDYHISYEEMRVRLDEAARKISETTEGIFSGVIAVNPYKKWKFDPCAYCDYKSICNKPE